MNLLDQYHSRIFELFKQHTVGELYAFGSVLIDELFQQLHEPKRSLREIVWSVGRPGGEPSNS